MWVHSLQSCGTTNTSDQLWVVVGMWCDFFLKEEGQSSLGKGHLEIPPIHENSSLSTLLPLLAWLENENDSIKVGLQLCSYWIWFTNHCELGSMELCEVHCLFYQIVLMSPHGYRSVAEVVNCIDCDLAFWVCCSWWWCFHSFTHFFLHL